jgi:hypothetical protein
MARNESDREDLLREATALVERIELAPCATGSARLSSPKSASAVDESSAGNIVAGFRPNGAASIFFGTDPVYQFNAAGELRRAYCGGLLLKASRGHLVSLSRERRENELQLLSHELTDAEQRDFLWQIGKRLGDLRDNLDAGSYIAIGQVPADVDVLARVRAWLTKLDAFSIANSPRV